MRKRTSLLVAVAVAAAVALALAGCTVQREPPPGPDLDELARDRVDLAWANSGLEGSVERPGVELSERRDFNALAECIAYAGLDGWMMGDGPDGPSLSLEGETATIESQLALFECFAAHPAESIVGGVHLTRAQRDYLYDYYRSWVLPCLALNSITVTWAPTREQYLTPDWAAWTPYDSTTSFTTSREYTDAIEECGSPFADLDIPSNATIGDSFSVVGVGG